MKKWLITGAAGFIGAHLADYVLNKQALVLGVDNFSTGTATNVTRLHNKYGSSWQCLHADICDQATIQTIFAQYRPDYVVHLAAQVSVPLSITHPQQTQAVNIDGFFNILLAAKTYAAQHFVYVSSSAVYGEQQHLPIAETANLHPLSLYGLSKKMNEEYAALFASDTFRCSGLRLFNIFGRYQRADNPYAGVIVQWLKQLQTNNGITIYGDGTATRDFCDVANVVRAIYQLITRSGTDTHAVYNIGTGQAISLQALGELLIALTGKANTIITHAPSRAGDIVHSQADIRLAQQAFGYQPKISLKEGLALMLPDEDPVII